MVLPSVLLPEHGMHLFVIPQWECQGIIKNGQGTNTEWQGLWFLRSDIFDEISAFYSSSPFQTKKQRIPTCWIVHVDPNDNLHLNRIWINNIWSRFLSSRGKHGIETKCLLINWSDSWISITEDCFGPKSKLHVTWGWRQCPWRMFCMSHVSVSGTGYKS